MSRVYNFSAGPSELPEPVLRRAAAELPEFGESGQSVMEMSHRSKEYQAIFDGVEAGFRETLRIPDSYKVLFLQGGASSQFAMVPLNLMRRGKADYIITGMWAKKAFAEGSRYGACRAVASSADKNFSYIPKTAAADFDTEADYAHICLNNTIYGTRFTELPPVGNTPLVADCSSCILSGPMDVEKFGLIYAGAQKNMGPAGFTAVIVREDLIGHAMPVTPTMFDYKIHADAGSMYNTPPTYPIYVFGLVLDWIKNEVGGLDEMAKRAERKAYLLYSFLDDSKMFHNPVNRADRSLMNITFVTGNDELDKKFVSESSAAGFINLKGHRSVGGMRASLYNAMPYEGVQALIDFMAKFEKDNG